MAQAENSPNQFLITDLQIENELLKGRAALADQYYNQILEQAKEIGRLEQRIADLSQRLEKTAGDASTGDIASVG